jgi:hypothetical protein
VAASTISHCKPVLYGVCAWRQWPVIPKYSVDQAAGRLMVCLAESRFSGAGSPRGDCSPRAPTDAICHCAESGTIGGNLARLPPVTQFMDVWDRPARQVRGRTRGQHAPQIRFLKGSKDEAVKHPDP